MIGIHTPETGEEKKIARVRKKVKDAGMRYPVAVDGSARTWQAWGNRFWPSVYLIDRKGFARYRWDGELNWKGTRGEAIMRARIKELLAEKE